MDGDLFPYGRVTVHVEFAAGEDPDDIVFDQCIAAAAQEHAMHAGGFLH